MRRPRVHVAGDNYETRASTRECDTDAAKIGPEANGARRTVSNHAQYYGIGLSTLKRVDGVYGT